MMPGCLCRCFPGDALRLDDTSRVFTVSSAGCHVLNYLTSEPQRILAVDLNEAHMTLTRLRLAALAHLPSHDAFFQFFGVGAGRENLNAYRRHIRPHLRDSTRQFWEARRLAGLSRPRLRAFEDGFYESGVFARFRTMAGTVSGLVQGRRPEALLETTSQAEQREFFEDAVAPFFDHPVVRRLARRPAALYSFGIPPAQHQSLSASADESIVDLYRDRVERLVCGFPLSENYFAWQAFGQRYDTERREALPRYLRETHFAQLRYHIGRVETRVAALTEALRDQPGSSFDSFVLLDTTDWMEPEAVAALWCELARVGSPEPASFFGRPAPGPSWSRSCPMAFAPASPTSEPGPRSCTLGTGRPSMGCFTCTCSLDSRLLVPAVDAPSSSASPTQKMDRMYRWTRHVYDLTRRYYLLGRNRVLRQIAHRPPGHVLEIGCGTARNLCRLHEKAPQHTLYGLDASRAMLSTARRSTERAGCATAVTLGHGLAELLDPLTQLGVDRTFDVIFFSYVLSMIPSWAEALEAALTHLTPGGQLYIIDFWDQAKLPPGTGAVLQSWLSLFGAGPSRSLGPL